MNRTPHDDAWLMLGLYANDGERSVIEAVLARIPEDDRHPYDGPRETLDEFAEWFDGLTEHQGRFTALHHQVVLMDTDTMEVGKMVEMEDLITAYRASRTEEWAAWRTR